MNTLMKNKCAWAVALLALLNIAVVAVTFLRRPGGPPPPRDLTPLWKTELGLSEEQVRQFAGAQNAHRANGEQLFLEMEKLKRQMVEHAVLHPGDSTGLDSLFRQSDRVHAALNRHKIQYYGTLKNLCTPEQQDRLQAVFLRVLNRPGGPPPPR